MKMKIVFVSIFRYLLAKTNRFWNENSGCYISNKTNDLDVIKTALEFQTIKVI